MNWLVPALVATTANSVILTAVYLYLTLSDRDYGIGLLFMAWMFYTVRFVLMLLYVQTAAPFLLAANQLAVLISAHLLLSGIRRWLGLRSSPPGWLAIAAGCGIWVIAGSVLGMGLSLLSLPVLLYAGISFIAAGVLMIRAKTRTGAGIGIVAVTLIIWGVHKLDYPFLRPVEWFAPWGYLIGAVAAMVVGIGMVLVYFEDARDRLTVAVEEREVLVREVHHRVKNNLGIIYALLQLQKSPNLDPDTEAILTAVQNRVASMSLIHEQLFSGTDLAHISAERYLNALITHVYESFGPSYRRITLESSITPVSLSPDVAVPCGLIVNELVSNCLSYAFQSRASGSLKVSFSLEDGRCVLGVTDDGERWDLEGDDRVLLSRQIVRHLVDQLRGVMDIQAHNGSSIRVSFPHATPSSGVHPREPE